jgi:hypothetical protein
MATEFFYPISSAPHDLPSGMDDASNVGGANKNASTRPSGGRPGPMTHDDGSTYAHMFANGLPNLDQALNVDWPGPIGIFTGVVLSLGWRIGMLASSGGGSDNTDYLYFVNAAGTSGGGVQTFNSSAASPGTGVYTTQGPSNALGSRPGGGSWTPDDFKDDKTIFARALFTDNGGGGNGTPRALTSVWGQLDYLPPTGGFAFLLASLVLGTLVDFSQFEQYLHWRRAFHPRHTILCGDEVRQAWREIREYKNRRYFFPSPAVA